jgi:hypothetical protein
MLNIVCFKWRRPNKGYVLPAQRLLEYGPKHVNVLRNMLARHVKGQPWRLICVTDDSNGIDKRVEVVPMWQDYRNLGGCYTRLKIFDRQMEYVFGERFTCIDLDCVIVDDVTPILMRQEPLVINAYMPLHARDPDQFYNGGLISQRAGSHSYLWTDFVANPAAAQQLIAEGARRGECIGTDQAWMRMRLGKNEARFTNADGVYEARQFRHGPIPKTARIVFFAGKRDPSLASMDWVRRNWQ